MAIEPNYRRIGDLDKGLPNDDDDQIEGDDHIRGIKSSLLGNFTSTALELWLRLSELENPLARIARGVINLIPQSDSNDAWYMFRNAADDANLGGVWLDRPADRLMLRTLDPTFSAHVRAATADGLTVQPSGETEQSYVETIRTRTLADGFTIGGEGDNKALYLRLRDSIDSSDGGSLVWDDATNAFYMQSDSLNEVGLRRQGFKVIESDGVNGRVQALLFAHGVVAFRVLDPQDAIGNSQAEVKDAAGTYRSVGFLGVPVRTLSASDNFDPGDQGGRIAVEQNGIVLTIPSSGLGDDYTCQVTADLNTGSGKIAIAAGAGVTLRCYFPDISVVEDRANFALNEGGHCRISRRGSSQVYDVYGNGMSQT